MTTHHATLIDTNSRDDSNDHHGTGATKEEAAEAAKRAAIAQLIAEEMDPAQAEAAIAAELATGDRKITHH